MLVNMEHGCLIERPVIIPPPLDDWVVLCRQCGKRHMGLSDSVSTHALSVAAASRHPALTPGRKLVKIRRCLLSAFLGRNVKQGM